MTGFIQKTLGSLSVVLLLLNPQLGVSATDKENDNKWDSFAVMEGSDSGVFFYDKAVNFSNYNKVLLFPANIEGMKISPGARPKYVKSWKNVTNDEWEAIINSFDKVIRKKFSASKNYELSETPDQGVIAIQIRLKKFIPNIRHTDTPMGTIVQSFNLTGLGDLNIQAALMDAKSKQVLVVVESSNFVTSGRYAGEDNKYERKRAWRKTFEKFAYQIHSDMKKLQRLQPVKK